MNTISVIKPYKWEEMWVFDDESKELDKEPLIEGADTFLDILTGGRESCTLTFSDKPFPNHQLHIELLGPMEENGVVYDDKEFGNYYYSPQYEHKLWLCPALFKYFEEAPENIYINVGVKTCSKHSKFIEGYTDMEKLAEAIGDLHYESLRDFMVALGMKLDRDADKDAQRGRDKLSSELRGASELLNLCSDYIDEAWEISKPHMED